MRRYRFHPISIALPSAVAAAVLIAPTAASAAPAAPAASSAPDCPVTTSADWRTSATSSPLTTQAVMIGRVKAGRAVSGGAPQSAPIKVTGDWVIPVTGVMDSVTWATWVQAMGSRLSTAQLWRSTQERLVVLGQMGRAHATGAPNPGTTRALQKMAGFPQTGVWGDATETDGVAALQKVLPQIANPPPKPTPAPQWALPKTHRIGANPKGYTSWHDGYGDDSNGQSALRRWQAQMIDRGWRNLGLSGADGLWSDNTDDIVNAFKTKKQITEVGLGPLTWAAAWETAIT